MMSPVRFDAAAFRTFEDDLTLLEAHLLDVFLGGVTPGDGSGIWRNILMNFINEHDIYTC